jgi:hypothetical protein
MYPAEAENNLLKNKTQFTKKQDTISLKAGYNFLQKRPKFFFTTAQNYLKFINKNMLIVYYFLIKYG